MWATVTIIITITVAIIIIFYNEFYSARTIPDCFATATCKRRHVHNTDPTEKTSAFQNRTRMPNAIV